jgi:hypothetical protein
MIKQGTGTKRLTDIFNRGVVHAAKVRHGLNFPRNSSAALNLYVILPFFNVYQQYG